MGYILRPWQLSLWTAWIFRPVATLAPFECMGSEERTSRKLCDKFDQNWSCFSEQIFCEGMFGISVDKMLKLSQFQSGSLPMIPEWVSFILLEILKKVQKLLDLFLLKNVIKSSLRVSGKDEDYNNSGSKIAYTNRLPGLHQAMKPPLGQVFWVEWELIILIFVKKFLILVK